MHILHSLPAALIRRGNIDPVHKIMQHSGRQFLQVGIFLRPEDELLNAVGFFLLLGNLLFQKLHFLRQLCLLIFIVGGQLFKSAIIAFLESTDFEDALRTAVSLSGDSDTLATITGSIAEAFYGVPEELRHECRKRLTPELARFCASVKARFTTKKSVVEFEMENKIRRGFHGNFELFRCA